MKVPKTDRHSFVIYTTKIFLTKSTSAFHIN